jgi:murein DD-endopeptidase MepM/ murein hydrolase activator NlpD
LARGQLRIIRYFGNGKGIATREEALGSLISDRTPEQPGGVSVGSLTWPVVGQVRCTFGPRFGRMHYGLDIAAATGVPVVAAHGGEVIVAQRLGRHGNTVVISHGGGFTTLYAHQSRLSVQVGESIERGAIIGFVGSTGRSTGPHLHFETRLNATAIDPLTYLPSPGEEDSS